MNKRQRLAHMAELKRDNEHLRRELRRMQVNADRVARVRAIELPKPANESEAQLVADMAQAIVRAIE